VKTFQFTHATRDPGKLLLDIWPPLAFGQSIFQLMYSGPDFRSLVGHERRTFVDKELGGNHRALIREYLVLATLGSVSCSGKHAVHASDTRCLFLLRQIRFGRKRHVINVAGIDDPCLRETGM